MRRCDPSAELRGACDGSPLRGACSSLFADEAGEAERSHDSSADLDHGLEHLGPKVTTAGAPALFAALSVLWFGNSFFTRFVHWLFS